MDKINKYIEDNYMEVFSVFGIFILALILRMVALNNYGDLVLDEVYSWYFASKASAVSVVKSLVLQDFHTPLYFLILHFWIKMFGATPPSMHFCSVAITLPLIPCAYCFMKKLFSPTAGYFAAIMLMINTFCVYFSVFARFYSLTMVLSLITAFLFVLMLEKFQKRYIISFIIFQTLLIYTFSLSLILCAFYALVGLIYLIAQKRNIKEFILVYIICAILASPAILFAIYNMIAIKSNLCLHAVEIFRFSWLAAFDMLENFFSSENYQIIQRSVGVYRNMFENIFNFKYFVLVAIPVIIGLWGLIKSLMSKNSKLYLLLIPSLLTILTIFILSHFKVIYYQSKYLLMVYPIIACACAYGLSILKNKAVSMLVFALFIYINSAYSFFVNSNVYSYGAVEVSGRVNYVLHNDVRMKKDDIIFTPFISDKVKMFIPDGKIVPFSFDEALLLKNKDSLKYYFGEDKYQKLDRNTIKDEMLDNAMKDVVTKAFADNLYNDYFKNMKKGQKFIIISPYEHITGALDKKWNLTKESAKKMKLFDFLMTKVSRDAMFSAYNNLKYESFYRDEDRGYCIYVFIKE